MFQELTNNAIRELPVVPPWLPRLSVLTGLRVNFRLLLPPPCSVVGEEEITAEAEIADSALAPGCVILGKSQSPGAYLLLRKIRSTLGI